MEIVTNDLPVSNCCVNCAFTSPDSGCYKMTNASRSEWQRWYWSDGDKLQTSFAALHFQARLVCPALFWWQWKGAFHHSMVDWSTLLSINCFPFHDEQNNTSQPVGTAFEVEGKCDHSLYPITLMAQSSYISTLLGHLSWASSSSYTLRKRVIQALKVILCKFGKQQLLPMLSNLICPAGISKHPQDEISPHHRMISTMCYLLSSFRNRSILSDKGKWRHKFVRCTLGYAVC